MIHPVVRDLFLDLGRHSGFLDVLHRVSTGGNASISGLTTTAKAVYAVLLWQSAGRPLVIVVDGNKQAEDLSEAVISFFNLLVADDRYGPQLLPALDVLPMQNLSPHGEICEQRAIGLWSLATQRTPITILPVASALHNVDAIGEAVLGDLGLHALHLRQAHGHINPRHPRHGGKGAQ